MIKLVAFDWNGTILADTSAVVAADNAVLKYFGLPKTNLKKVQATYIIPVRDFWLNMGLDTKLFDANSEKIVSLFMETYEPFEQVSRTRSGVRETLIWLTKHNLDTVIISNHVLEHIQIQLKRLKLADYFNQVLARPRGDNSHMHSKSKELKLKDYIKATGLKPKEVVVLGDTEEEIEISKNFGCYSIALTGGNVSTIRLKKEKPDYLIHNLIELKKIIKDLNQ
jgi:phosphoglycolate phosphatase